jgi:CotS family spore coat protein
MLDASIKVWYSAFIGGERMEEIDSSRIDFEKAIESKNGYLLYHRKSKFILKETSLTEWEILALSSIMDYIESMGFSNLITLKKDVSGKPYCRNNERLYLVYEHFEGSKLRLNSLNEGVVFAEFIAGFHNIAEGYVQPAGIRACVLWGKRTEEYRALTLRFEKNYKLLKLRETINDFESYIIENGEAILNRARASMKILKSIGYLKALESSMRSKEVCLNKISNNTAVISNNEIILKKVFDMGYNMVEEDIALLVKKIIEQTSDLGAFEPILESYTRVRDLRDNSSSIIKAIAAFPEETLKIIDKYFKKTQMDDADLAKLKKYWGRESKVNLLEV